ncbi:MAG: ATP synthase F0 subunit B [Deltaproteobacteria bacterium]|nr:ATP synthase F0 subunit B [Deltaproteobacteria bacterium]
MNSRTVNKAVKLALVILMFGFAATAAGAAEHSGAEHQSLYTLLGENPLPLLKDFLWRLINIGVLLWILIKFAGKPFREFFAGRKESLLKGVEEAREAKAAAEKVYSEYQAKLAGLETELLEMEERSRQEARREQERMQRETEAFVAKLRQQARQMAEQEVLAAKRELRDEAARLALEVAERLVRENINDSDRRQMVENYLGKIVRA